MTPSRLIIAFIGMQIFTSGCLPLDRAADREIEFHQLQSTDTYPGPFQIDTSQLPTGAALVSSGKDVRGNPTTHVELRMNLPVRIIVVPSTQQ